MKTFIPGFCLAFLGISVMTASADTLTLQGGREFEGKVLVKGSTYTVLAGDKVYQFDRAQVSTHNGETVGKAATAVAARSAVKPAPTPAAAKPATTQTKGNPVIKIKTAKGDLTVELFEDEVPNTVANIIALAEKGFYRGMRFHRIIPGFMAQGGCPNSKPGATGTPGTGGPGYRVKDEFRPQLKHSGPGVLSMANSGPNTNGSQFFICFQAAPHLDGRHTVFGKVVEGLDVLKALEAVGTRSGKPTEQVEFDIEVVSKRNHPYQVEKV